jgi:hypothetical protein
MSVSISDDTPSIRSLVEALDVGETFARAIRFDADETQKDVPLDALRALRLSTQATVHRISQRTGNNYTIESGEFRTTSRDIMACLCITRTA